MPEEKSRNPRVLAIDAGGTMTDTFIVDDAGRVRRRQGADHARGRVGRLHALRRGRAGPVGLDPRRGVPEDRVRHLQRHGDAQPAALAQGPADRRDRDRRPGGLPAPRARDPDLPRLLLLRPAAPRHPPPQRAARPARADEGRARAHRRDGHRGAAAARGGGARGRGGAARRRRGGNRGLAAVLLPQRRARDPRGRDPRGGQGLAVTQRRGAGLPVQRAVPDAARPAAPEHHPDRGLRGRAVARHAPEGARRDQGAGRRPSSCG